MVPVLIGRQAECERLELLLESARGGRSATLVVEGEAGIGKSALLEHAATLAHDFRVLRASGSETEQEIAFGALLALCRPLLPLPANLPIEHARALEGALGVADPSGAERFLVGAGMLGLLAEAALPAPVLVLVDDFQWVDGPSAQALVFAARRLQADAVAVVVTLRTSTAPPVRVDGLPRLTVVGLEHSAARALISSTAPDTAEGVADRLHAATGGNPLALQELLRTLSPAQRSGREVLPEPLPSVSALERSYAAQVDRLSSAARRALTAVAVVGDCDIAFIGPVLAALGGGVGDLATAVDGGLLGIDGGRARWRHPLIRSAVFYRSSEAARHEAHLAVAGCLPDGSAAWAWHRAAAAVGPDPEVAQALVDAAGEAAARTGYATAAAAFEHAARLSASPRDVATRLLGAADSAWLAGDAVRAARLLDEALVLCREPEPRGRMLRLRAHTEYATGDVRQAADWHTEAAGLLEATRVDLAAQSLAEAALARWWSSDPPGMLAAADRLQALAGSHPELSDHADFYRGLALSFSGRTAEGTELLERSLQAHRARGGGADDPRSLWAMIAPGWLGRPREGRAVAEARIRELRARGALGMLPRLLRIMASQDLDDDRWTEAAAEAGEALELCSELGQAGHRAEPLALMAVVEALRGDDGLCCEHATQAIDCAVEHGQEWVRPVALRALGLLKLGRGSVAEAADLLLQVVAAPDRGPRGAPMVSLADLVEALVRSGQMAAARAHADQLERRMQGVSDPLAAALLARCRALTAGDAEARGAHEEAVARWGDGAETFGAARTRLLYGEWLRRRGERRSARAQLQRALAVFEACGARPWTERARGELVATGATLRARPAADVELTPSELRVALLAVQGLSNRDISAQLFLSPKTVEFHLGRVFAKLGVRSRTQLARRLAS
jgi:DNA-binding CsgD family transcriptional regulator